MMTPTLAPFEQLHEDIELLERTAADKHDLRTR